MLKEVHPYCAGLDVHKKFVTVCRLTVDSQGTTHAERRKFSTMTDDLETLAKWLSDGHCTHVAMASVTLLRRGPPFSRHKERHVGCRPRAA